MFATGRPLPFIMEFLSKNVLSIVATATVSQSVTFHALNFVLIAVGCLAVNYHESARYCYEKSTLSSFSTSTTYSTCLVNYKGKTASSFHGKTSNSSLLDGEDPCDSAYMHSGRTRSNFYYRYYPRGVIATPKDCCVECRQDSESSKLSALLSLFAKLFFRFRM